MKIDLSAIDRTHFNVKEGVIAGETFSLITPKDFGCEWTTDNLHLRSVIVDQKGEIRSLGQKKFFNYTEKPNLYPNLEDYKDWVISDKADGSLLIWSNVNHNLVVRTRGVMDARVHENSHEIDLFLDKYPKIRFCSIFPEYSLLTEWLSPTMRIVIEHEEPDVLLLDVIRHSDASYLPVAQVDEIARDLGMMRPTKFQFNNLADIVKNCEILVGREGYVLSYNDNANRIKLKGANYLLLHRFKSQATLENTIDLFIEYGYPTYNEFEKRLIVAFDEDCAKLVLEFCERIVEMYQNIRATELGIQRFVAEIADLPRKSQAEKILAHYGPLGLSSYAFCTLDKRAWDGKMIKKLLLEKLK